MEVEAHKALVICISPGLHDRWDVSEKGSEQPLASFDDKEDAYAYAINLTKSREAATVLVENDEGFQPLPLPHDMHAGHYGKRPGHAG